MPNYVTFLFIYYIYNNVTYCRENDTYITKNDKFLYESNMRIKKVSITEMWLWNLFLNFWSPYMLLICYVLFYCLNYIISKKDDIFYWNNDIHIKWQNLEIFSNLLSRFCYLYLYIWHFNKMFLIVTKMTYILQIMTNSSMKVTCP